VLYALRSLDEQLLRKRRAVLLSNSLRSLLLGVYSQNLVLRISTLIPQVYCMVKQVSRTDQCTVHAIPPKP
jgi:hypothetical protein